MVDIKHIQASLIAFNLLIFFTCLLNTCAGADVSPGWHVMAKMLFRKNLKKEGAAFVQQGMRDGFVPDSQLGEMLCKYLCENSFIVSKVLTFVPHSINFSATSVDPDFVNPGGVFLCEISVTDFPNRGK